MLTTATLIAVILSGQVANGDDDTADDAEAWIGKHLLSEAADYKVFVKQDDELTELSLEEPLLHYYDPLTNVPEAYVLVWTRKQRPEACAVFWVHPSAEPIERVTRVPVTLRVRNPCPAGLG